MKVEILRIINALAYAFRNEPKYKIVDDTRNLMKMEGLYAIKYYTSVIHNTY